MKDHYQLTDESYEELLSQSVTVKDMYNAIPLFDRDGNGLEIGIIGLLHYVDKKGDFNSKPIFPHKRIATAIFNQLAIKDKIMVAEYIELAENNYEEVDEDFEDED